MDPQASPTGSKTLPILLAILLITLIVGGGVWFYLRRQSTTEILQVPTTATTTLDPKTEAKTEITSTVDDIDSDLAEIEADEKSEDDTIDF